MTLLLLALACGDKDTDGTTDGVTGDSGGEVLPIDADGDGYDQDEDCNDNDDTIHPFSDEYCDGIDNDCDEDIDEDSALDAMTWYEDLDGDGYGNTDERDTACEAPDGYVSEGGDCDDDDTAFNPGAVEDDCTDDTDYNCDDVTPYEDADEDGWPACEDCDDDDPDVHPDATEVCDGIDNDCDGDTDDDDSDVDKTTRQDFWPDDDNDGYGDASASATTACGQPDGYVEDHTDCDDDDGDVNPGATEVCDAGDVDEDCNGKSDDDDSGVDGTTLEDWWRDSDNDGYGTDSGSSTLACDEPSGNWVQENTDCDDGDADVNPGETEVCDASNTDEDCSGAADDNDSGTSAATKSSWYEDGDDDGYGAGSATKACDDPSSGSTDYVTNSSDCDDSDADVNPGETEICDASDTDEDCNGVADDDDSGLDASSATTWYTDDDGDGYGADSSATVACDDPSSGGTTYGTVGGDCDDTDEDVNPGETEICDLVDNDCDSSTTASGDVSYETSGGAVSDVTSTFNGTYASPAAVSLSTGTYTFCGDTFYVRLASNNKTVDIIGVDGAELSGGDDDFILYSYSGADTTFTDITLMEGNYGYGGAVRCNDGTLEMDGVTVKDNASSNGGAVYLDSCDATMTDTVFDNNQSNYLGGVFRVDSDSSVSCTDCEFTDNQSALGSVFNVDGGTVEVIDSDFDGNYGTTWGAIFYIDDGGSVDCTASGSNTSVFSNNTTSSSSYSSIVFTRWSGGSNFTSDGCSFSTGGSDNDNPEFMTVTTSGGSTSTYNKGNNQSFTCDRAGCY